MIDRQCSAELKPGTRHTIESLESPEYEPNGKLLNPVLLQKTAAFSASIVFLNLLVRQFQKVSALIPTKEAFLNLVSALGSLGHGQHRHQRKSDWKVDRL